MKAKINTNLFPIISVGMYESQIDSRYVFDDYRLDEDFNNGHIDFDSEFFHWYMDGKKYDKKVEELAKEFLSEIDSHLNYDLAEFLPIKIKAKELYSPQYYNFATDQIELVVKFSKKEAKKRILNQIEDFKDFLEENYSSYDGFHSFTANNYGEWSEDFKNGNVQAIGAALSFLFRKCIPDTQQAFYSFVIERMLELDYEDLLEDGALELLEEKKDTVKEFTRENYGKMPLPKMIKELNEDREIDLSEQVIDQLCKDEFQKITNELINK